MALLRIILLALVTLAAAGPQRQPVAAHVTPHATIAVDTAHDVAAGVATTVVAVLAATLVILQPRSVARVAVHAVDLRPTRKILRFTASGTSPPQQPFD